jgi:hypothetical protein
MTDVPNLYRVILQESDLDKATECSSKLLDAKGQKLSGDRQGFETTDLEMRRELKTNERK